MIAAFLVQKISAEHAPVLSLLWVLTKSRIRNDLRLGQLLLLIRPGAAARYSQSPPEEYLTLEEADGKKVPQ